MFLVFVVSVLSSSIIPDTYSILLFLSNSLIFKVLACFLSSFVSVAVIY